MKRFGAYPIYLLVTTASSFFFTVTFTTSAIYRFQTAELNPLQLVLVGTALEAAVFIFEVPTGIVADLYSRRLSIIIGYAIIGLGFVFEGAFPFFVTIILAQVIWGTGYTFTSGATDAWLADELGEDKLVKVYLRGAQFSQVAAFVGIFIGVGLAALRLSYPYWVGGSGLLCLSLFLVFVMPETGFNPTPQPERNTWQKMVTMFGQGAKEIRRRPLLITIMSITLFYGLYSEALDRLWETHFLTNFTFPPLLNLNNIVWFGLIEGGIMLITILSTGYVRRRLEFMGHRTAVYLLLLQNGILIIGLIIFGLATNFSIALLAYFSVSVARATGSPIYSAWINRGIEPKVRATVLSTINQMDAVGQVLGGPAVGTIATRLGLRWAMVSAGLILSPVIGLFTRALGQESLTHETVSAPLDV